ncbi:hypothetical protein Droror1_Dr00003678 [Drosera rotundifolia]
MYAKNQLKHTGIKFRKNYYSELRKIEFQVAWISIGRANVDPKKRDDHRQEARPHEHDRWHLSSPPRQPLCERVKMAQDPETEEHASKQLAPLRERAVQRPCHSYSYCYHVYHHDRDRRNHQEAPPDHIKLRKLVLKVFWCRGL